MSNLKPIEKRGFEDLFGMASGYVMDFTNATFAQFFQDTVQVDIYSDEYAINGDSKAKRLRAFWEIESDKLVGKVLNELLDYWEYENDSKAVNSDKYKKCRSAASRLTGAPPRHAESAEEFLERKIDLPDLKKLNLDHQITAILVNRLQEIEKGLNTKASLSVIFMCGSVLEGALLGVAIQKPKEFNQSTCSPKDNKTGKVHKLQEWTLAQLIDVACDIKLIKLDVKKFSHVLRDFRNYIHPYEQSVSGFTPDHQTAGICFQVLKAALSDLSNTR